MAKKPTQLEKLQKFAEEIIPVMKEGGLEALVSIVESIDGPFFNANREPVKGQNSEIAKGYKQFLYEMFSNRHPEDKQLDQTTVKCRKIIEAEFPDFFAAEQRKIERAIKRGKIKTEDEYYLIRDLVDDLEGSEPQSDRLNELYKLVDEYAIK